MSHTCIYIYRYRTSYVYDIGHMEIYITSIFGYQSPKPSFQFSNKISFHSHRKISGYNDVSGGSAYYWSCAFHCEGGQYFATEGCICACLTPAQEAAWRGSLV